MKEIESSGPTVEEAVAEAAAQMGVDKSQLEVEVLAEASGEAPARIRARVEADEHEGSLEGPDSPGSADSPDDDLTPEEVIEYAREDTLDFLEGVLESMELDGEVRVEVSDGRIQASMEGEDLGLLIGRHGHTLDALQELLRSAVQRQARTRVPVNLDVEGYRDRRRVQLENLAQEVSIRARAEGRVELEPMTAFERKIVHDAVGEMEGVSSESEGEEPNRRVVIIGEQPE